MRCAAPIAPLTRSLTRSLCALIALSAPRAYAEEPSPPAAPPATSPATPPATPPSADIFRETLSLQSNSARWAEPGFRLALEYTTGALTPLNQEPRAELDGVALTVGARLDPAWSALARASYALASGGVEGLNLQATLEPTLHLPWGFSVGAGLGLGAVIEFESVRPDARPGLQTSLVASYDHPRSDPALPACEGFGPLTGARVSWALPLGPASALTLSATASALRVRCVYSTERVEPDTASPIERRQDWAYLSWLISGGVMWR